jgi:predicted phage baseplate assembly protein
VVRVDQVKWDESDSLARLGATDREYLIRTDDAGQTSVIFGNGEHGARLPTGVENVRAIYRNGIGKLGNVEAQKISLLVSKPLGVKEVVNPLRAGAGAGPEDRDQARRNAPLAVLALDHLVSVQDYADFARTFAGIGKASAARLTDGRQQVVHLTIAGADDIPIDVHSDLYRALRLALRRFGSTAMPVRIDARELMLLTIHANVRVLPAYDWALVEPRIRATLLDAFGFARRDLGQDVFASEVVRVIHAVRGVEYVDLQALDAMNEGGKFVSGAEKRPAREDRIVVEVARADPLRAAQLAVLSPEVPDTIILEEIPR